MHDDRYVGVLQDPPDVVEQRVVEVELPHLQVQLEQLHPGGHQLRHVRRDALLREERRRPQRLGDLAGEGSRPVVQVRRHTGLVRVRQRREPAYAHLAEQGDPVLVRRAVADRPLATDLGAGGVEDVPDRLLDVGRQEVHVHVDQAGQPQPLPEGPNGSYVLAAVGCLRCGDLDGL
jgi:hypothetical protein